MLKNEFTRKHSTITINLIITYFVYRAIREQRYKWEILEIETPDVLDRALVRAKANKELGAIDAPTYFMIEDKVKSLKKLKFTQEYESW